jgi:NAD-dependent dihydropyrimidine dehydrogenase PreA subunit
LIKVGCERFGPFLPDINWIQFFVFPLTRAVKSFINPRKEFSSVRIIRRGILAMAFKVAVEGEKCKGCEDCLEVCTVNVFEMKEGKSVPVDIKDCLGCGSCVEVCKEEAIKVEELNPDLSDIARSLLGDIL